MGTWFEFQADRLIDLGLAALIVSGFTAFCMLASSQPVHRIRIARLGMLGLVALPILDQVSFIPDLRLGPYVVRAAAAAWLRIDASTGRDFPEFGSEAILPILTTSRLRLGSWPSVPGAVSTIYGLVVAGLGARLVLAAIATSRIRSKARALPADAARLFEALTHDLAHHPEAAISDQVRRPLLIGLFRPLIVLPSEIAEGPRHRLAAVLTHELAHARESDMIFGLLAECLLVVAFPVAPLWWIRRQTRLDQELLADALTVERLGAATEYAAELVAIAGTGAATPTLAARSVGSMAPETDGSDLYRRVLVLLRSPQPILTRPSLGRLAGMTAAIAVAVLAAGILDFRPGPLMAAAISPARHAAFQVRLVAVDGSSSVELPAPSFTAFRARGRILGRRDAIAQWEILGLRPHLAPGPDPTLNAFREVVDLAFEFESRPGRRRLRVERGPWVELSGFGEPTRFLLRNPGPDSLVVHSMSIAALTAE